MRFVLFLSAFALAACDSGSSCEVADSGTATATSTVTVDYIGTLSDGTEFDSGSCAEFPLQSVVPGFREGITGMDVGEEKTFTFGPEKGYGDTPRQGIPPGSDLTFFVKLYEVR